MKKNYGVKAIGLSGLMRTAAPVFTVIGPSIPIIVFAIFITFMGSPEEGITSRHDVSTSIALFVFVLFISYFIGAFPAILSAIIYTTIFMFIPIKIADQCLKKGWLGAVSNQLIALIAGVTNLTILLIMGAPSWSAVTKLDIGNFDFIGISSVIIIPTMICAFISRLFIIHEHYEKLV